MLYAGRRNLPIQWNELPAGTRSELSREISIESIEQTVLFLLPHLKQRTVSNVILESFDRRVHDVLLRHKEGMSYSYSIRQAILILYTTFTNCEYPISAFMEEEIVRNFIEIAKVLLSKDISELRSKNDQLGLVIQELEREFKCSSTHSGNTSKEGTQKMITKHELDELKKFISVKELSVKFHGSRLSSNDSAISSFQTRDFHNPFYELDESSFDHRPSLQCNSSSGQQCKDDESISPSLATSNTQTNFPGIKIPTHKGPIAYVRTVYAYEKQQDDELSFPESSIIAVFYKGDDEWWNGELACSSRAFGWFPSNYAQELMRCTVTQNYSNQIVTGRTVYAAVECDNEWIFVYVPECEWSGIVPIDVLDLPKQTKNFKSPSPNPNESVAVRNEQQHAVLLELISTENTYVQNLSLMIQFYYKPLKAIWSESEISLLFCNSCDLLESAILFCNEIGLCENGMMVAKLFKEHSFDPYVDYCTNQSDATEYMIKRLKIDKEFVQFTNEQQKYPDLKGKDLGTFLLEPMQRITRYPLLLKQLIKHSQNSLEIQNLTEALEKIEAFLAKLNSLVQERERDGKLRDLNNRLVVDESISKGIYSLDLNKPTKWMGKRVLFGDAMTSKVKGISKKCKVYIFNDLLLFLSVPKTPSASVSLLREPLFTQYISIKNGISHRSPFVVDICYESQVDCPEIISIYLDSRSEKNRLVTALTQAIDAVQIAQIALMSRNSPSSKQFHLGFKDIHLFSQTDQKQTKRSPPFPLSLSIPPQHQKESKAIFVGTDGAITDSCSRFSCTLKGCLDSDGHLPVRFHRYEPFIESPLLHEHSCKPNKSNQNIHFQLTPSVSFKAQLDVSEVQS